MSAANYARCWRCNIKLIYIGESESTEIYCKQCYDKLCERIKELEADLKETMATFEDNNKTAYNEGYYQGRSYQAICENRGRDRFLKELKENLCDKCKEQVLKG